MTARTTLPATGRRPAFVLLCLTGLTIVYPVVYLGITAFRTNVDYLRDPLGWPEAFTLRNFVVLWNNYGLADALYNSVRVVAAGLVVQLVVATVAGYALAKLPVPGARAINATFVSVMLIPSQVLIIPIFLMLSAAGLVGDLAGLVLVYAATGTPFAVFFMTLTFRGLDDSVLDAARIDGAGFVRTLLSVVVPLGKAGLATLAVLQFLTMWNELLFAYIILPDSQATLLMPALAQIGGRFVTDQPLVSAGLVVTALPPLVLLAFAARYLVAGISAGIGK
jgi:ABC-type glycerol-3-phosphate transport system permease component